MRYTRENPGPGTRFGAIPEARRCQKVNRLGQPCGNVALRGCSSCQMHGGWDEARKLGRPCPPHLLAGNERKKAVRLEIKRLGAEELWTLEAFRRGSARVREGLLQAWVASRLEEDPGMLRRAVRAAEEEQREWMQVGFEG